MRIALAEHTTVTYHTEEGATKTQAGTFVEALRLKLGFPTTPQSKYAQRRKDHHTEHGVTTIVDISALEKVGNTFSPGRRGSILRSSSASHESRYGGLHHGGGNKKNGAGQHGVTFDDSGDELPMKEIHVPMPVSPPAAAMPPRAITFDLPEGHALSSSLSGTTHISRGDIVDPEMMALNRRPTTATRGIPQNGLGRAPRQADVPVLFVGEGYHHRSDVTSPPATGINLKNAITVTTEKVTKAES